jgi:hypothetical protein
MARCWSQGRSIVFVLLLTGVALYGQSPPGWTVRMHEEINAIAKAFMPARWRYRGQRWRKRKLSPPLTCDAPKQRLNLATAYQS